MARSNKLFGFLCIFFVYSAFYVQNFMYIKKHIHRMRLRDVWLPLCYSMSFYVTLCTFWRVFIAPNRKLWSFYVILCHPFHLWEPSLWVVLVLLGVEWYAYKQAVVIYIYGECYWGLYSCLCIFCGGGGRWTNDMRLLSGAGRCVWYVRLILLFAQYIKDLYLH